MREEKPKLYMPQIVIDELKEKIGNEKKERDNRGKDELSREGHENSGMTFWRKVCRSEGLERMQILSMDSLEKMSAFFVESIKTSHSVKKLKDFVLNLDVGVQNSIEFESVIESIKATLDKIDQLQDMAGLSMMIQGIPEESGFELLKNTKAFLQNTWKEYDSSLKESPRFHLEPVEVEVVKFFKNDLYLEICEFSAALERTISACDNFLQGGKVVRLNPQDANWLSNLKKTNEEIKKLQEMGSEKLDIDMIFDFIQLSITFPKQNVLVFVLEKLIDKKLSSQLTEIQNKLKKEALSKYYDARLIYEIKTFKSQGLTSLKKSIQESLVNHDLLKKIYSGAELQEIDVHREEREILKNIQELKEVSEVINVYNLLMSRMSNAIFQRQSRQETQGAFDEYVESKLSFDGDFSELRDFMASKLNEYYKICLIPETRANIRKSLQANMILSIKASEAFFFLFRVKQNISTALIKEKVGESRKVYIKFLEGAKELVKNVINIQENQTVETIKSFTYLDYSQFFLKWPGEIQKSLENIQSVIKEKVSKFEKDFSTEDECGFFLLEDSSFMPEDTLPIVSLY